VNPNDNPIQAVQDTTDFDDELTDEALDRAAGQFSGPFLTVKSSK